MGDRLRAGIPHLDVTKPTRSTQPCTPWGWLNRVVALIGWDKGGNVTSRLFVGKLGPQSVDHELNSYTMTKGSFIDGISA